MGGRTVLRVIRSARLCKDIQRLPLLIRCSLRRLLIKHLVFLIRHRRRILERGVVVGRLVERGRHCLVLEVLKLVELFKHVVAVVVNVRGTTIFWRCFSPSFIQNATNFLVDAVICRLLELCPGNRPVARCLILGFIFELVLRLE